MKKIFIFLIIVPLVTVSVFLLNKLYFTRLKNIQNVEISSDGDTGYPLGTKFNPSIFKYGYVDGHNESGDEGYSYEMNSVFVGDLYLESGKLVIDQPYIYSDLEPLDIIFKSGTYPVYVSEAIVYKDGIVVDKRNALVKIKLSSEDPVIWEYVGIFAVDGASGGFIDYQIMKKILLNGDGEEFTDKLLSEFEKTYKVKEPFHDHYDSYHQFVNINYEEGNLIAFTTGWGDGAYASYIGYDSNDNVVEVLTDFRVIWWEDEEYVVK